MRKTLSILMLFVALTSVSWAQKYACVNTDYILKSIPDYTNAQKRLDKYVADWQKELQDKQDEVDAMRADYEQESYLLPDNLKKRRQEELKEKEQELKALQRQRFGADGDLDKKRAELLKPVQDSDEVLELLGYKPGASAEPPKGAEDKGSKKPSNPEMRQRDNSKTPLPLGKGR